MADVYTPPPDSSYLLVTPFSMPSVRGDRWAVSFTGNSSALVAAALSVVVTISFLCLWNFVSFMAVLLVRGNTRHRYVAVVTLWNSNDSWFAFKELLSYTYRHYQTFRSDPKNKRWGDFFYALIFCLLAFAVFGSGIAMGIVAPSLVQIGNVAPVRPSTVFYPATPVDSAQELRDFGLRAPSVMRALGSVEAARVTLRERVFITEDQAYAPRPDGDRNVSLDYRYSLSGVEMGIVGGSDLRLTVEGHCFTEYGWKMDTPQDQDPDAADWYRLWNWPGPDETWTQVVLLNEFDTQHAPLATFMNHPNGGDQLVAGSDMLYSVMVHAAWRSSITAGGDPWYATESRPQTNPPAPYDAQFRMKRHRPVLSCGEKNSWTYAGRAVTSVVELKNTPGMKIPTVLLEILETTLGGGPMVVRLGNASGDSALRSRTTSPNGVIDAGASSMHDDMERLILASYVATRNLFTDAVMFGDARPAGYANVAEGPDGQPREGAGHFVVSSPDIQTFSLTGIVTLAVILLVLILLNASTWLMVHFHHTSAVDGNNVASTTTTGTTTGTTDDQSAEKTSGILGRLRKKAHDTRKADKHKWTRFHVLSAAQLFRCVYETGTEPVAPRKEWSCDSADTNTHYANGTEELALGTCSKSKCMGHIVKGVQAPEPAPSTAPGSAAKQEGPQTVKEAV